MPVHYVEQLLGNYGRCTLPVSDPEQFSVAFELSFLLIVRRMRFGKRQQMQWSKGGAHLMLQARTRTLDARCGGSSSSGTQTGGPETDRLKLNRALPDCPRFFGASFTGPIHPMLVALVDRRSDQSRRDMIGGSATRTHSSTVRKTPCHSRLSGEPYQRGTRV